MSETFEDWISKISGSGSLCAEYKNKVDAAQSNKQLVDIVMDANGMSYLPEMISKGMPLPYDVIKNRFAPFINGRYIGHTTNSKGHEYTSAIYCGYTGDINNAGTTLLTLLGCSCVVNVSNNSYIHIYVDGHSKVQVNCPKTSHAIVEKWDSAEVSVSGDVKITAHGKL